MKVPSFSLRVVALLFTLLPLTGRLEAKIGALGRIIPAGDILYLSGSGDVVSEIHVKEGQVVEADAVLLTFRGQEEAARQVALAELDLRDANELGKLSLESAELKLEIVKRDYEFARQRLERFGQLGGEMVSPQQMEQRAYQTKNAEIAYQAAQKDLERTKQDQASKSERATIQLALARAKLDRATLRAPRRLTVLKINAAVGAVAGGSAISLANLAEMQVTTEVFAGDLAKLKLGQVATVTGSALPAPQTGRVISVGRVITGRAKVVEVLIKLDDPKVASELINLEVNVSIDG